MNRAEAIEILKWLRVKVQPKQGNCLTNEAEALDLAITALTALEQAEDEIPCNPYNVTNGKWEGYEEALKRWRVATASKNAKIAELETIVKSIEQAEMPAFAMPWGEYDEEDYNAGINACKPYLVKLKDGLAEIMSVNIELNKVITEKNARIAELEDMVIRTEKVAKLQSLDEDAVDIETIAEDVHKAYCQYCIDIKGEEYWTKGDYSKLTEEVKQADRYTARAVIKAICSKFRTRHTVSVEEIADAVTKYFILNKKWLKMKHRKILFTDSDSTRLATAIHALMEGK